MRSTRLHRLGPVQTSRLLLIKSAQSGRKSRESYAHLTLDLLAPQAPLEHEGAHSEAFSCLFQRQCHFAEIDVAEELAKPSLHLAHCAMALALCLKNPAEHLVKQVEVSLAHPELLIQLRKEVRGKELSCSRTFFETGLEGEEDLAGGHEAMSQGVEPRREMALFDGRQVFKKVDRDSVAYLCGFLADFNTLRLRLGRGSHCRLWALGSGSMRDGGPPRSCFESQVSRNRGFLGWYRSRMDLWCKTELLCRV